jgi:hypothetical protein
MLLKQLLLDSAESFGSKTHVVLDAFDECAEDGKMEFIEMISKLLHASENVYLLITSRPHSSLATVSALVPAATQTIPVIAGGISQTEDLKRYLEEKMAKEWVKDEERKFMVDGIAEKAAGLYTTLNTYNLTFKISPSEFAFEVSLSVLKPEGPEKGTWIVAARIKCGI